MYRSELDSLDRIAHCAETYDEFHRRAPQQVEVTHDDSSASSMVDVDSPHISSVPSDYEEQSIQTDTQAERERLEEESKQAAQQKKEEAREKAKHLKEKAEEKAEKLKKQAGVKKEQAKSEAKKAGKSIQENSDNPVFIGNAVTIAAFGGVIGYGAYRKYTAGELTWKIAGLWAGAVGLFGVADYYVSS